MASAGRRAGLDEAGGGEVSVEGQSLTQAEATHEHEAGRIDIGVRPFVVTSEPAPRLGFGVGLDGADGECSHPLQRVAVSTLAESI